MSASRDRHGQRDRDLDDEIHAHLEMAKQDRIESGATPEEAEHAARRELGNELLIKEVTRDMWRGRCLERLVQDSHYALRMMRRGLSFYAAAVVTLALGIGATAAVFSVVDAVLLRPLAFPEPDRLVRVFEARQKGSRNVVNGWNVLDWRERSSTLAQIAAIQASPLNLTGEGAPVAVSGQRVQTEFFAILGVPPLLGRGFAPEEGKPGQDAVAVLSYGLWQRRFGGDERVIGRSINVDGRATQVVGVMPSGFAFPKSDAEIWVPLPITRDEGWGRGRSMTTVARLASGATLQQAQQELARIAAQTAAERPSFNKGWTAEVHALHEDVTHQVERPLYVLLAGVSFLLLIACANVANLLLMRGAARQGELAVRAALGAGRARIVQQLLAEALLLSCMAAALGLVAAHAGLRALVAVLPSSAQLPRVDTVQIDARVLGFGMLLSIVTAVLAGLVPAFQAARRDPQAGLRCGSLRSGVSGGALRACFVTAQIALALVLLVGAGLVMRSFRKLINVDPGFRTERVLSLNLWMSPSQSRDPARRARFVEQVLAEISSAPGVHAASSVHFLPLTEMTSGSCFVRGDELPKVLADAPSSEMLVVSPRYFEVLGTPILAGRDFDTGDVRGKRSVVVVNRTFAERFFPGSDPIGQRLSLCWSVQNPVEIVGMVADARQTQLRKAPQPTIFIPNAQSPMFFANLVVRAQGEPRQIAAAVQAAIRRVDPEQAVSNVRPMSEVFTRSVAGPRFQVVLLSVFGGIALLLCAIGIYAAVTYSVTQRVPEIGIRMALGAARARVAFLVLRQGLVLAGAGIALGLAVAASLTRVLETVLFDITPTDPPTLAAVSALLAAVALASSAVPARRAMAVDPMTALRNE
jgi:putative ABC transport system permease protein